MNEKNEKNITRTEEGRVIEHPGDMLPHNLQKVDPKILEEALLQAVLQLFSLQRMLDPEDWKWRRINQTLNAIAETLAPAKKEQRKVTELSLEELQVRCHGVPCDDTKH